MIETSCTVATSGLVAWSLFAGISAHEMEEFVWPGGFRAWYIRHSPSVERSMSKRFLIGINAVVLLAAAMAAWRFASPSMRFLWLTVGSAAAFNGLWHLQATLRTRRYSPGVVTGALVQVPLVFYGFTHFMRCDWISPRHAISAAAYGAAYWIIAEGRKLLKRERPAAGRTHLSVLR